MAKQNNFVVDDRWQREVRDRHLLPFYEKIGLKHIFIDPAKKGNSAAMYIQKDLGIDTLIQLRDGRVMGVEEKIVRWPEDDEPHTAYALETFSCTVPGHISNGWMYYTAADVLLWAFEQENGWLMVDIIPMQPLKNWFFEEVSEDFRVYGDTGKIATRQRLYNYNMFQMPTKNRSETRIVPCKDVFDAIDGCRRYLVDGDNISNAPDGYMPKGVEKRLAKK